MIAGATNAGKTTMLRALAAQIGSQERIVTIEKALEIGLRHDTGRHPNVVEMEERVANAEGQGALLMSQLVRRTLRMNPDRVIVGEVLGPEIVTMLNAMSQGNDGSLSTIHARTPRGVFDRISTYALQADERLPREACQQLIAGGLDFVVFLGKDGPRRYVDTILEINGFDPAVGVAASEIFTTGIDGLAVRNTDVAIAREPALLAAGWQPDSGRWLT
jgi:Flp pilus assembly CpaF family ATPase